MQFEIYIIKFLQSYRNNILDYLFNGITQLGHIIGFVVFTVLILIIHKKTFFCFLPTYIVSVLINSFIFKPSFSRVRPYDAVSDIVCIFGKEKDLSFPSGHSLSIMVCMIFLCYAIFRITENKRIMTLSVIISAIMILFVGISRMYLGKHYLTDVLAGYLIGVIMCMVGIKIYNLIILNRKIANKKAGD